MRRREEKRERREEREMRREIWRGDMEKRDMEKRDGNGRKMGETNRRERNGERVRGVLLEYIIFTK